MYRVQNFIYNLDKNKADQPALQFTKRNFLRRLWHIVSLETLQRELSQDILEPIVDSALWSSIAAFLDKYQERHREMSTPLPLNQGQGSQANIALVSWDEVFERNWIYPSENLLGWDVRDEIWAIYQEGPEDNAMTTPTTLACECQILTANVRTFCENAESPKITTNALENIANLRKALAKQMVDFQFLYEEIGKLRLENSEQKRAIDALSSGMSLNPSQKEKEVFLQVRIGKVSGKDMDSG
jgi:hypothetical protein